MTSSPSVSSPPNKSPKTKTRKAIDFGPFIPTTNNPKSQRRTPPQPRNTPNMNLKEQMDPEIITINSSSCHEDDELVLTTKKTTQTKHTKLGVAGKPRHYGSTSKAPRQRYAFQGGDHNDINVNLCSANHGDKGVVYLLSPTTSLRFPTKDYAKRVDVTASDIKLINKGQTINPLQSAETLGLQDGETIYVEGVDPFINTDTRYKLINIHETVQQSPMTLEIMAPVTMTLVELYQKWADFVEEDVETFTLMYDSKDLRRSQRTIGESPLVNGADIYCRNKEREESDDISTSDR